jgi:hypothetical protein
MQGSISAYNQNDTPPKAMKATTPMTADAPPVVLSHQQWAATEGSNLEFSSIAEHLGQKPPEERLLQAKPSPQ